MPKFAKGNMLRIALALAVLALFLANALGLLSFSLRVGGDIAVSDNLLRPFYTAISGPISTIVSSREFVLLAVVGLVLSFGLPLLSPIMASVLTVCASFPVLYFGYVAPQQPTLIPVEYSLLTILMLFSVNVLVSYFTETRQKQRLIDQFSQYVPPELVAIISKNPEKFSMEGESQELSVMFCDVQNFTGISEELNPKEVAQLLNTLFTPLTRTLHKHRGTIDKYMGDSIMAFWGAPVPDPDHAQHALAAAFEIHEILADLRGTFRANGWPEVTVGIGINSGLMNVGNMGSEYRMAYTVIGDSVNLAARLERLTRIYNTRILAGEATIRAIPGAVYRELGLVHVKGKGDAVRVYEPHNPKVNGDATLLDLIERHSEGLRHYYTKDWDRAAEIFESLREKHPDDPVYSLFLERIEGFRHHPPPAHWRGEIPQISL